MNEYKPMLKDGKQIEVNKEKTAHYFKIAADKDHLDSMYCIHLCLKKETELKPTKKSRSFFQDWSW